MAFLPVIPNVHNGVDGLLPVDLYVPGCPYHPLTLLDGALTPDREAGSLSLRYLTAAFWAIAATAILISGGQVFFLQHP